MSDWAVVIGVGNEFRRDDGVGLAVVSRVRPLLPRGVRVVGTDGEPSRLLDAWRGVRLAVVVDAATAEPARPGRVHHSAVNRLPGGPTSSHGMGLPEAVELARALDGLPERLVVLTIEVADVGFGLGLSPPVARAVPEVAETVLREVGAATAGDGAPR
ncbi:hydrogenase maturation protease [Streptoalloteichus hindustanus]|uniref:Hydrogenase maturation protease n=1 Tax=Streptoalloteichus hindustanus TaxID=2017 RepID=A0A1M5DTB2_STRHI|nr:hydrogenase maturation protease [Streptoalloteichus hindustanus]SHF70268.1 hydrogenase maturation protease [Streptoalloteichus hindustanus]